jgi:hypothetical protein
MSIRPSVAFLSYSWEGTAHEAWVLDIARRLRLDGVEALLDKWETRPGDDLAAYMESGISRSDFVLIFCTPSYRVKASRAHGGVRFEGSIMTGALVTGTPRRKFVPILRGEEWTISAPPWLLGSFYLDFRANPISENAYQDLLDTLLDRREAPPLGQSPSIGSLPRTSEPVPFPNKATLTSSDESSWPFVWKQLIDTDPHDEELRFIGMEWLRRTEHMDTWPYVWQTLLECDPNSEELRFLGMTGFEEAVARLGHTFGAHFRNVSPTPKSLSFSVGSTCGGIRRET